MSRTRFNPAPGWPIPPEGWEPPDGWTPPDDWPKAPEGWNFRVPVDNPGKGFASELIDKARSARGQSRIADTASATSSEVLWEGASSQVGGIGGGRYRLTRHYLYFEAGVLRTDSQQVPLEHITDIDLSQTMIQKARGVATVRVHVQRPDGPMEMVTMENLTESRAVQDVINQAVRARKAELTRESTTHTYLGGSAPAVPQAAIPQPVAAQPDIIDQITRLGELHKAGVLSQEEFESKKAELLGRL